MTVSDGMLNLMAARYGISTGQVTLESFISLIIRLDCMKSRSKETDVYTWAAQHVNYIILNI